ncbi:MAG: tRNA (adenosine(37)-N6)-threonylcarbamoyltransferase complex ATPase subunit type 1 TsaE [Planctomycetota bacterium]
MGVIERRGELVDAAATRALGVAIGSAAVAGDVIALDGELGVGKTAMTRGIAAGMGLEEGVVSSPTFTMVQEYRADGGGLALVHIDAYRLGGVDEVETIGWVEEGAELRRGAVVVVEWAEKIAGELPKDRLCVRLTHAGEGRGLWLGAELGSRWAGRLNALMAAVSGV